MNTPDRTLASPEALSIAELEARFEMEALPVLGGSTPITDWACACQLQF